MKYEYFLMFVLGKSKGSRKGLWISFVKFIVIKSLAFTGLIKELQEMELPLST